MKKLLLASRAAAQRDAVRSLAAAGEAYRLADEADTLDASLRSDTDRIRTIARREGISQAQVVRDLIRAGLAERERQSEALTPKTG